MSRIPNFYRPPLNLPLYWRDELSGVLIRAVEAYLDNRISGLTVTDEQVELIREYLVHYINAPCWDLVNGTLIESDPEMAATLSWLRSAAVELDSASEIDEWIKKALDIGLDPL